MNIGFSIGGEWLTDFIRQRFLYENMDYEWVVHTISEMLKPNGLSDERIEQIAQDVILGRSYFKGQTRDGSFTYCDGSDELVKADFFKRYNKMCKELAEEKKVREEAQDAWKELALVVSGDLERSDCEHRLNIELLAPTATERFIDRMATPNEESKAPYGLFDPGGEFYPVDWCGHQEFARKWIVDHHREQDFYNSQRLAHLDYLVRDLGWIVLHNPNGYGDPYLTSGDKPITKKQREALFDYYTKAGMKSEANALFQEQ